MDIQFWVVPILSLLGGAAGAAIINGIFGLGKHRADRNDEHSRWLRDKKQEACIEFIAGCEGAFYRFRDLYGARDGLDESDLDAEMALLWKVETTSPRAVATLARDMLGSLIVVRSIIEVASASSNEEDFRSSLATYSSIRNDFVAALRQDLGVAD